MGKIFCIVGKSASGKDTLYQKILEQKYESLQPIVSCTTRPRRVHEIDGKDYFFVTEEQMHGYAQAGEILEQRQYDTVHGIWYYFTRTFVVEPQTDYLIVTTLEAAETIVARYGEERVCLVYLELDDRERLLRCIARESQQKAPNYEEVCRRFLADQHDFSAEKLSRFRNLCRINTMQSIDGCLQAWERIFRRRAAF